MGTEYEVLPIPAIERHTRRFDAGPLIFGVEYRLLNEEIIAEEYGDDARAQFGNEVPPGLPAVVDEDGVSVHVFGRDDGLEYLRFDCFDDYPHYHYIEPQAVRQTVMEFDPAAAGPMLDWVVGCLRERLPEMLRRAGARDLAEQVADAIPANALDAVEVEMRAAAERGRP